MAPEYDFNIRDYWLILKKRKIIVIVTTVMMAILTFLFANYQKIEPIYEAVASIKIDRNPPIGEINGFLAWGFETGDYVETQARLIRSFPVMVRAAKELGMVERGMSEEEVRQRPELLRTVLQLKDHIETEKEGITNIVHITARANDPVLAEQIANTVAKVFRQWDFEQKNKRIDEARRFIERQLKKIKAELQAQEDQIRLFKEQTGSVPLETQASEDFKALIETERALTDAQHKLQEVSLILKSLREERRLPTLEELGLPGRSPTPVFQTLNNKLNQYLVERDTLLLEFTEEHPKVKALSVKIEKTIEDMIEQLASEEKTLQRKVRLLRSKLADLQERIAEYPEMGLTLARLERNVKVNSETYAQLEERYQDILIRTAQRVYDISVIRPAVAPSKPVNQPAVFAITMVGTFMGLLLGGVLAFVFETLDTSIGAIDDVERLLNVPVLGLIPHLVPDEIIKKLREKAKDAKEEDLERQALLTLHYDPRSTIAESYRALRTNVQYLQIERGFRTFIITSTNPLEGKSSIVANLAITFAQMGKRTLLVDCDLRKPEIHRLFGIPRHDGLTDIILGNMPWQDTVKSITELLMGTFELDEILQTPGMDNLHIITCGSVPPNPSELLMSERMDSFLKEAREAYDVVLIDSPPVIPVSDPAILGAKCDGVILVYEVGKVGRNALKRAKFLIENVKGQVVGIVLNKVKAEVSPDFHELEYYKYYGKYGYGRGYGVREEEEKARRGFFSRLLRRR
jgi:tyrosine-protein kinase Etk/Wzc